MYGNGFEEFFLDLMTQRDPGFFDIRTRGRLGDRGADGLMIDKRNLFACYGPQTIEEKEIIKKINGDLASAQRQRPGAFDTFTFVHTDRRGMDPVVSIALSKAKTSFPDLAFANFGYRRFLNEILRLERHQIEDLLGCQFPAKKVVTGVALRDVRPLLEHLAEERKPHFGLGTIPVPSHQKMEFNAFSADVMTQMTLAMTYVPCVETYYTNVVDPVERDDVAATFREHYLMLADLHENPDQILEDLIFHILGNEARGFAESLNALVVLMYFFGECDIFKMPPAPVPAVPVPRANR
ncbi:ABC-three component system protein [Actinomadura scrupuli]|uniref:ABC-three component system protein n=1 Tax=Actinomadura scrupuli TaxID=559629 RepID=UPI003D9964B5